MRLQPQALVICRIWVNKSCRLCIFTERGGLGVGVATSTRQRKLLRSALAALNAAVAGETVHLFKFRAKLMGNRDWSHLRGADIYELIYR